MNIVSFDLRDLPGEVETFAEFSRASGGGVKAEINTGKTTHNTEQLDQIIYTVRTGSDVSYGGITPTVEVPHGPVQGCVVNVFLTTKPK
jgi:hypothetical protein